MQDMRRGWGLLTVLFLGCGTHLDPNDKFFLINAGERLEWYFDADLAPYVDEFFVEAEKRFLPEGRRETLWRVEYGEITEEHLLAYCMTAYRVNPINNEIISRYDLIKVREEVRDWEYVMKRAIMFHEMGHCVYDLQHLDSESDADRIMAPKMAYNVEAWYAKWNTELDIMMEDAVAIWGTVPHHGK